MLLHFYTEASSRRKGDTMSIHFVFVGRRQCDTESEKDWELRNKVPEEGFKSEEGWYEILHILLNFFRI